MQFSPYLQIVTLLRRYKRFLADVVNENGNILTVHCPNTGSMLSCSQPGSRAAISCSGNPRRKYPWTLEMVQAGEPPVWVGVNTARTNDLVEEALRAGKIQGFDPDATIQREVSPVLKSKSRLDFCLTASGKKVYMEVKNCSLVLDGQAFFPDAVTERGRRHLCDLSKLVADGHGAAIFFLVQRADAQSFSPADHIDPVYGATLRQAVASGVRLLAYRATVSPQAIHVDRELPCLF